MKVNGPNRLGAVNQYKQQIDHQHAAAVNKKGQKKDQVEISSEALELLNKLNKSEAATPRDRIEELKKAVADGTYQADPVLVAEKLLPFIR